MITTIEKAKEMLGISDPSKDEYITNKLKALESVVRNLTNNKFQDTKIRSNKKLSFISSTKVIEGDDFYSLGFRVGNTIDIDECLLNKGIFTIENVNSTSITVKEQILDEESTTLITKMVYPFDVIDGVVKLIQYDLKMGTKIGVKSETLSRYSVTYYDVNSTESIEGYPATLMKFLNKYKRLRWS